MTSREALSSARLTLESAGIESAALAAEVLLRHTLSMDRVKFFQNENLFLSKEEATSFFTLVERHIAGEPVAYLTGHKEFYGLDFNVDRRVLIPRPETELLVEAALNSIPAQEAVEIADIGTGSGAIAVAIAVHRKKAFIFAVDSSSEAVEAARQNAEKHHVAERIRFLTGDLLSPLPSPVAVITANLPYVRTADLNEPSIRCEPKTALDGGTGGLDTYMRFIPGIENKLKPSGRVFLEIGENQSDSIISAVKIFYPRAQITVIPDYNKINRVLFLTL